MQCFCMSIVELILNLLKQDEIKGKLHVIKIRIIKDIFARTHNAHPHITMHRLYATKTIEVLR